MYQEPDPDLARASAAIAFVDRLLVDRYWERLHQPRTFIDKWVQAYINACRRLGAIIIGERAGRCGIHGPYDKTTICPECARRYS